MFGIPFYFWSCLKGSEESHSKHGSKNDASFIQCSVSTLRHMTSRELSKRKPEEALMKAGVGALLLYVLRRKPPSSFLSDVPLSTIWNTKSRSFILSTETKVCRVHTNVRTYVKSLILIQIDVIGNQTMSGYSA